MKVIKRDGTYQGVDFNKITNRIQRLCNDIGTENVEPIIIAQKVCNAIHDNVTTIALDKLAAEIAISMCTVHYDYSTLAAYIVISDMHKKNDYT